MREKKPKFWRRFFTFVGSALFIGLVVVGIIAFRLGSQAKHSGLFILSTFKEAAHRLVNFEISRARESFQSVNEEITKLRNEASRYGLLSFAEISQTFNAVGDLGKGAFSMSANLEELKNDGFSWVMNQQGDLFIQTLKKIQADIVSVAASSAALRNTAARADVEVGGEYLDISVQLTRVQEFLKSFITWLESPFDQQILVLFQNPSEIRPGGGFIGSYGMVTLRQGSVVGIDVRDIYDPDGQMQEKIVPPKTLQLLTPRWGARDANWFFDFPTSAGKVVELLEFSKIYREQFTKFSGVIAINIGVVQDLIQVTGAIELPEYKLIIDENNVLSEIQREVESGEDKKAGQPKKILKILTPLLLERLGKLDDAAKQELVRKFSGRILHKDIMMYFKDLAMEAYLKTLGVAGDVQTFPTRWTGGYLAVVNANIAGGKSDAFIKQSIELETSIDLEGRVTNQLAIKRKHEGAGQKDYWYQATNKNYIQIYLPAETELSAIKGNEYRKITPPLDYAAAGYRIDPDVSAIESSREFLEDFSVEQFRIAGKTVFGTWLNTVAGKTGVLELSYANPQKLQLREGAPYEFVYEKQSGVSGPVKIIINAPAGYKWLENDSPVFIYETDNPERRISIMMTLAALPE